MSMNTQGTLSDYCAVPVPSAGLGWTVRGEAPPAAFYGEKKTIPPGWTFIYFVKIGDFIKIGSSSRWKRRVNNFCTGSPFQVDVLLVQIERPEYEKNLHKKFRSLHHRGEWFRAERKLLDHIARKAGTDRDVSRRPCFQCW